MPSMEFRHRSACGKEMKMKVSTKPLLSLLISRVVSPNESFDTLLVSVQRFILPYYAVSFCSELVSSGDCKRAGQTREYVNQLHSSLKLQKCLPGCSFNGRHQAGNPAGFLIGQ